MKRLLLLVTFVSGLFAPVPEPQSGAAIPQGSGSSSRTDVENFMLGGSNSSSNVSFAGYTAYVATGIGLTGPAGIAYNLIGTQMYTSPLPASVMVFKKISDTWTPAAGTIDVQAEVTQRDGSPAAGTWDISFYLGCLPLASGSSYSYGTASATVTTPPAFAKSVLISATGINIPASCAAKTPIQFWLVYTGDSAGTTNVTGVYPIPYLVETVIRGN